MSRAREVGDLGSVVTVDDGKVGIGTSSPEALLHVNGDTASQLILQRTTSGATGKFRVGIAGASNTFIIYDLVQDLERLRITSDGYLRMASGSGGIQFGGDTAAANALDDYEEGTWTVTDQSGAGLTLSGMNGYYTKIGRTVIANFVGNFPATANGAGCKISLPFTTATVSGFSAQATGAMMRNSGSDTVVYSSTNVTYAEFYPPTAFTAQTNANMSGVSIIATLVYQAA